MKTRWSSRSAWRIQTAWIRWCLYTCFFLSGATALILEVLWSREFITVFGNSSYAISIVLCAYMAGLGLGGLAGGRLADRITQRTRVYGAVHAVIGVLALLIPMLLGWLRAVVPTLSVLAPNSLLVSTLARFGLSFAILLMPCFLMGTTLPLLVRAVTKTEQLIGTRLGVLYCWNTLGAAFGCLAAGFWMIDTLGVHLTNLVAVCGNFVIAAAAVGLSRSMGRATESEVIIATPASGPDRRPGTAVEPADEGQLPGSLLLGAAFVNGVASLACEVLWFRYLAFLSTGVYVLSMILCVYLVGLGLGGLVYGLAARRLRHSTRALGLVELLLAVSVLGTLTASALIFAGGPPWPLTMKGMICLTVLLPTVLMGISFPLLCCVYGRQVQKLGRSIGLLFAVNTAGAVLGSLLPIFVLVPALGIQRSLMLMSLLYGGTGVAVLACGKGAGRRLAVPAAAVYGGVLMLFVAVVPSDLCQRVFLATNFNLDGHTDILFYREGRTGTAIVTRDRVNDCKTVYINGVSEVPVSYVHQICFKMLGALGPMLHPNPDEVLMICFGGGIAAGTTVILPEVKSLTIVDLERSVVYAANTLSNENNGLLQNSKAHVVIDDGRNYVMMAQRKWPVIVSDSTHPKQADSWVLYTREFYHLVQDHLTDDGVFVEWLPRHGLHTSEFKIIARTFQSVFEHASVWVTHGMDAQGQYASYTLLVATARPLKIDVARLQERLNAGPVQRDLQPFGLHTAAGFLDPFLCGEESLRRWAGEGPINTDDLPYTQYETRYSRGTVADSAEYAEPMEEIWPYLTGTGDEPAAKQLRAELGLRAKANRLAFLGRLEEAYAVLPDDVRYRQLRRLYEEGPHYSEALLKSNWNNPHALVSIAEHRMVGPGGVQATRPIYERVLELDPDSVPALNTLAALYSGSGNVNVAENYLRRAVRLAPEFDVAHYNFGLVLERTGRHAEAVEQWRQAALLAKDPRPMDQWAICLERDGHTADAIFWFNRCIEIRPFWIPARLHLANLLCRMRRVPEAVPHVRYVLKMDPENQAALNLLAKIEAMRVAASGP